MHEGDAGEKRGARLEERAVRARETGHAREATPQGGAEARGTPAKKSPARDSRARTGNRHRWAGRGSQGARGNPR